MPGQILDQTSPVVSSNRSATKVTGTVSVEQSLSASSSKHHTKKFRHMLQVASLLSGLTGVIVLFILLWPNRFWLRLLSIFLGVFYVLWGTLTHRRAGSLSKKVFWEYAGIATLGTLMLWLLL